jgi:glycine/D-amino acid oxidase-like deaminating enzyme
MFPKPSIFWTIDQPPPPPSAALPAATDVAIIGGGITGLSAAHALGRMGVQATLLERQHPGWGASSRNGGMVLTGLKLDAATLIERYGVDHARRLFHASLAAIDYVEQLVRSEGIACNFQRSGHLVVAAKPAHTAGLRHEAEVLQRAFGHATQLLNRFQLADEIGSSVYYGGLVDPLSAAVHPGRYTAGLAAAAQRAGARLCSGVAVERVERRRNGFTVHTSRGELHAAQVIVASGGYTGRATPHLQRKVFPLGSYIIVTAPLPADLARTLIPQGRMVFDTRHLLAYYRLTPDGRMLFGGRAAFFPEGPRTVRESGAILQRAMLRVFPQLRAVAVDYVWGGTLDAAFDLMPHAGVDRGVHYALGYAGHGVALASYLGALLAAQVSGRPVSNPFAQIAFPGAPLGLYWGQPWFLPFAGIWYKWLDIIG